ncbi:MAG: alpha/beta hydrolase family protein [Candidatus Marinimicrobia bacterium]|nr:alpha/beta hydrolase family protein [Candidatus Neomarinimicrobiota bacterium]
MKSNRTGADLQPVGVLWDRYRPDQARRRFTASEQHEARRWQAATRKALAKRLGLETLASAAPEPRLLEEVDKGDYVRQKILMRTGPHSVMPFYLLLPKAAPRPLPVVLAFHGHGYGVKDIVGLWENGAERDTPDGYHRDFAVALCRAGFAVAAPEISCFGERATDFSDLDTTIGQEVPPTCTHAAMLAFHLGLSVVSLRVHDGLRLVDYLATRQELDTRRLGAMGISGGGMHTFFSGCLDTRIRASVISGYYATFRDSILAIHHCPCNIVPGLAEFGEMYDLVGLIAPRPLLIESGTYDPIFPVGAVRSSVARARRVYDVFGARDRVATDIFEGRHRINGRKAYDFLAAALQ